MYKILFTVDKGKGRREARSYQQFIVFVYFQISKFVLAKVSHPSQLLSF